MAVPLLKQNSGDAADNQTARRKMKIDAGGAVLTLMQKN